MPRLKKIKVKKEETPKKQEVSEKSTKRTRKKSEFYNEMFGKVFQINPEKNKIELDNLVYQPIDDNTCQLIDYKVKSKIKNKLVIPDTVKKYRVVSIAKGVFSSSEKLKEVILPKGLIEIGPKAFSWCRELSKVNLPSTLKYIGYFAFECCDKIFSSNNIFDMPDSLEVIGNAAFSDCFNIEIININRNLKYIGNACFSCNYNLKTVNFGINKTVRFGKGIFYNCSKLKTSSSHHDMSII